ncbi:flippase [Desulfosarcina ovata subsp. ovata]|uniref:Flippase n=2 Tax=Desulfosarcina ovata TaxID=83564 RepID=A0A5K8A558_9BACT|nr:flippase [Desulfosarcina ovata subsp. ovata]
MFKFNIRNSEIGETIKRAALAFVIKVMGAGLAFIFNLMLARIIGADGSGIYFLALTITTITTVLGRMGLDNSLLRFVAAGAATKDWSSVKGVYNKSISLSFLVSLLAASIVFIFADFLTNNLFSKPELLQPLRLMIFAAVPMSLLLLNAQAILGLKKISESQLINSVGVQTIIIIGVITIGRKMGINGVMYSYLAGAIFIAFISHLLWKYNTPQLKNITGEFDTRKLLDSCLPLFWVSSMNIMMNWTGTFLLGIWGSSSDVGIFSIAVRNAMLISFILHAVNAASSAKYSELYHLGDISGFAYYAKKTTIILILISTPICLFFVICSKWIMGLFGASFIQGWDLLTILAIAQFLNVAAGSVGPILMMSGNEVAVRNSIFFSAVLNLILCMLLIPDYGTLGAACANSISLVSANLYCIFEIKRRLGFSLYMFTPSKERQI